MVARQFLWYARWLLGCCKMVAMVTQVSPSRLWPRPNPAHVLRTLCCTVHSGFMQIEEKNQTVLMFQWNRLRLFRIVWRVTAYCLPTCVSFLKWDALLSPLIPTLCRWDKNPRTCSQTSILKHTHRGAYSHSLIVLSVHGHQPWWSESEPHAAEKKMFRCFSSPELCSL